VALLRDALYARRRIPRKTLLDPLDADFGPRRWPLRWQYLLALSLIALSLLLRELLAAWVGEQLPFLMLFAVLLILVLLVRPGPFLVAAAAAVGGAAVMGRWHTATPELDLLQFTGAVLAAGMAAWLSGRLQVRQRQLGRQAAQQRELLSVTLQSIADAIITTDAEGRITFMNPAASEATAWPLPDAIGQPLAQVFRIVDERTRQPVDNPVDKVLRDGRRVGLGNHTLLFARDGRECPIDDSAAPIRASDGRIQGVVLVFRDISERRRAEAERAQAERRKDEFLATLAHELRNPLAPAVNGLQILDSPTAGAEAHERARGILHRQLKHLVRLIEDLMDVSRITHGRLVLQRTAVSLQDIVRQAVEACQPIYQAASQQLDQQIPDVPIALQADPVRLVQILCNLLGNASKFSPPRSTVLLRVQVQGQTVELALRDQGVGLAAEQLPHLFEMFQQGPSRAGSARGGLGIGLALSRRLAELHGGSLQARSAGLGLGSEFVLRLPLADVPLGVPAESEPEAHADRGTEGGVPAAPASWRVLVVDDNQDAATSLTELLRMHGHDACRAYDGLQALAMAQELQPQALILDVGLPGLSGHAVARQLRAQPGGEKLLLVAVSGWGQEADRHASAEAGFDAHMVKPVQPQVLLRLLAERRSPARGPGRQLG
jgi:PAS domain S-box-containing protein